MDLIIYLIMSVYNEATFSKYFINSQSSPNVWFNDYQSLKHWFLFCLCQILSAQFAVCGSYTPANAES